MAGLESLCMNIHQISVKFDAQQDRLLVQVNTRDGQLLGLWLTRRLMRGLFPQLEKHERQLATGVDAQEREKLKKFSKEARQELADMQRDQALQKGDFVTPFVADQKPVLSGFLLVTSVTIGRQKDAQGQATVNLKWQQKVAGEPDQGLDFALGKEAYFGFYKVLVQALERADWFALPRRDQSWQQPKDDGSLNILN